MPDRILKPDSGNDLILQNDDGSAKIEVNENSKIIVSSGSNVDIDLTPGGTGEVNISKVDINSGTIDNVTIGTTNACTELIVDNLKVDGNSIISTNSNGNINLTPNGTGEVNITKVDIDSGTIDGVSIDVSSGTFTTSSAQKQAIVDGATIEAQDLASGSGTTLPNNVQDAITRLGSVTSGTIGSGVTINTQDYIVYKLSSVQTISTGTTTVLHFNNEVHDPNNWFNTSTYRFLPNKAGKYFFSLMATVYANQGVSQNEISKIEVSKNDGSSDSAISSAVTDVRDTRGYNFGQACTGIVDLDGSDDYLFATARYTDYQGNGTGQVDNGPTLFSIFRIGS